MVLVFQIASLVNMTFTADVEVCMEAYRQCSLHNTSLQTTAVLPY